MAKNKIKILVIDDFQDNLITLNALIKDAFPEAITLNTQNGETGLDLAAKENPDVILLDILMPGMDGYEVCQKLKADKNLCDIPVVFITAIENNKEALVKALESGGEAFLTKPIDEIELTAQIRAMLKIKEANDAKKDEKVRLEKLVKERSKALVQELDARKQAEKRQKLHLKLLDIINQPENLKSMIRKILIEIKKFSEIEAVGIRLREGEDYPYFETKGFPARFVELERYLCSRYTNGEIERDAEGNPCLECMCGNVIRKRTDPSYEFFTDKGSYWSNNTTKLLAETSEEDRQARTRNRCNGEGYESVALVPLTSGEKIVGLLQFNDRRTGRFTKEFIEYFENIGNSIGIAFSIKQAEKALHESEEKYKSIVEGSIQGIVIAQANPIRLSFASKPMETITGYSTDELMNFKPKDLQNLIHPDDRQRFFDSFQRRIKGEEVEHEAEYRIQHRKNGVRWIALYSSLISFKGEPATQTVFIDITERKQAENELSKTRERLQFALEGSQQGMWDWTIPSGEVIYNDQWAKLFGYKPDEVEQTVDFFLRHVHPKDLETVKKRLQLHLDQKTPIYESEHRMLRKDGEVIWTLDRGKVTEQDLVGKPLRATGLITDISKVKQAEAKLKMSEEKFRTVMENSPFPMWISDENGIMINANKSLCNTLDLTKDQLFGNYNVLKDENLLEQGLMQEVEKVFQNNESIHFTMKWSADTINHSQLTSGRIIWLYATMFPLTDENGGLRNVVCQWIDITEQREAEEKVIQSESRYKQLVETASDAIYLMDEEGIIIDTNHQATQMLQREQKDIVGKSIDKVDPNFSVADFLTFWKVTPFEQQKIFESTHIKKNEELIPVEVSGKKFKIDDKIYYFGVARDITERKKAELALIESEERYNLAMNASNDGLFDWNLETNAIYYSPAWKKMLGYEDHELPNDFSVWEKTTAPEDVKKSWELQQKLISKQIDRFVIEFKMKHKDGHWIDILSRARAIFDDEGKAIRMVGTHTDITERKQFIKTIQERNEYIESIMENMPIGFSLNTIDDGDVKYMNDRHEEIYGWSRDILTNRSIFFEKVFPEPEFREKMQAQIMADMESGDPERMRWNDLKIVSSTGDVRYVYAHNIPLPDQNLMISTVQDVTERKLAEEELIKLSTAVQQSPSVIAITDTDGKLEYVNPQFTESTGYSMEEAIGQNPRVLKSGKQSDELYKELWETISAGNTWRGEFHNKKKNGELFWELASVSPIFNEQGKIINYIKVAEDITERKQAEDNFRHSIDESPLGIRIVNQAGKTIYVNKALLDIYEFSSLDEYINTKSIERYTDKSYQEHQERKKIRQEGGDLSDYEISIRRKNGEIRHIKVWRKEVIWNREKHFQVINQDITELKRLNTDLILAKEAAEESESKIKLNEQRLNALVELGQMTDKSNDYIYNFTLNKAIELTQSQIGFLGFVNEDETEVSIYNWSESAMKECTVEEIDMRFKVEEAGLWGDVLRNREAIIINDYTQPITTKKGLPAGHVHITNYLSIPTFSNDKIIAIISVSNKKGDYSETDIMQLSLLLNGMRRFFEQRREKEKLIEAMEKTEESNRLKTAFLNNMSHEIRTPLNGITGFIGLLQDSEIDDKDKHNYFDIINKSSNRLIATVTDIIDISRIEAGEVKVSKKEVSVNEILEEQYNFFYHQAQSKGIELIYEPSLSDREAQFVTDKHKLEGILTNLIKNAIKFTEQGAITFSCSLKKEQGIDVVEFYVKDTGIGIPANRLDAIFNRFEQADIEDTRVYEGSGLGLAIAKSYVEMLGGEISVSSEVGSLPAGKAGGSTFTFSIPYTKHLVKESNAKKNINKETQIALSNLSVIIAEDDETSVMFFNAIFKNNFNKIIYAKTGKETIDSCRENPETDLILMDIKMPDMNGYDATREIRKFNSNVVIIAQTAYGLSGDREKAIDAGCNGYIAKPIKKEELLALIQTSFNK